jgi:AAA domain/Bifunctional DNA primase/polymerase, N-terminal
MSDTVRFTFPDAATRAVMSKRQQLWNSGYRPVAVYTNDKRPFGNDWTGRARHDPPEAAIVSPWDDALNTGILCDGLRAIDCDIDDPATAGEVERLALAMLGAAPIRKRADSSRCLLLYRAYDGAPNKRILAGNHGKVEVLGFGQQLVSYGFHPSGAPYQWNFDPSAYSCNLLTAVTELQLTEFLQSIVTTIGARADDALPSPEAPSSAQFDPSQPLSQRDRANAAQALRNESEQLAALGPGCGRNNALNRAGFVMGTLVANGSIEESAVRKDLYNAAITNGHIEKHGPQKTLTTLNSGLNEGKKKPRPRIAQSDLASVAVDHNVFKIRSETPTINSTPSHLSEPLKPVRNGKRSVTLLRGSEIEARPVRWLWQGFLPSGKLTILAGAGGTGKSTLALGLGAAVTTAGVWPDGTRCSTPGNVLIWSSEDDVADTIKPRMTAAGADASRYGVIEGTRNERGDKRPFDPANDMEPLREAVKCIGGASLLIIDPIVSAVTGDMHKANDVRRNLQAIIDFAAEFDCAVIGISHFAKATAGRNPTERVIGSQAFSALARMVLVTAKDEQTNNRVFTRAKSNNSLDGGGFSYSIESLELPTGTATRVVWGAAIEGTSREILSEIENDGSAEGHSSAMSEAKEFLIAELANGCAPAKDLVSRARQQGISEKTLRRAQKQLGVQHTKEGYQGEWVWALPSNPISIMRGALR